MRSIHSSNSIYTYVTNIILIFSYSIVFLPETLLIRIYCNYVYFGLNGK